MLTPEQKTIGRRNFLKAAATLPAVAAFGAVHSIAQPVRCGIIGGGNYDSEGRVLMENAPTDVMKIVAVAEIFEHNRNMALDVLRRRYDPNPTGYEDYREMLAKADIEAVIVTSPLWLHAPMTIDALNAGKHVFCEKTMARTMAECRAMMEAARSRNLNLQIGHQRFYNDMYWQTKEMIDEGLLGDVYHIRMLWHRNGSWRRPIPQEALDAHFDPRPFQYEPANAGGQTPDALWRQSLEHWRNWRLYDKYSRGLWTELASHQIAISNWYAGNKPPRSVSAYGGIYHFGGAMNDDRDLCDHVYGLFEYDTGLTVNYTSIQTNAYDNYYEQIMGTKGTIILTGETEAMYFKEGEDKATVLEVERKDGDQPLMSASASRTADAAGQSMSGSASGGGNRLQAYTDELRGFCQTIREGRENLCDGQIGHDAALAVLAAHESMEQGKRIEITGGAMA